MEALRKALDPWFCSNTIPDFWDFFGFLVPEIFKKIRKLGPWPWALGLAPALAPALALALALGALGGPGGPWGALGGPWGAWGALGPGLILALFWPYLGCPILGHMGSHGSSQALIN